MFNFLISSTHIPVHVHDYETVGVHTCTVRQSKIPNYATLFRIAQIYLTISTSIRYSSYFYGMNFLLSSSRNRILVLELQNELIEVTTFVKSCCHRYWVNRWEQWFVITVSQVDWSWIILETYFMICKDKTIYHALVSIKKDSFVDSVAKLVVLILVH